MPVSVATLMVPLPGGAVGDAATSIRAPRARGRCTRSTSNRPGADAEPPTGVPVGTVGSIRTCASGRFASGPTRHSRRVAVSGVGAVAGSPPAESDELSRVADGGRALNSLADRVTGPPTARGVSGYARQVLACN